MDTISYEQWGVDFFQEAISEDRVLGAVNTIAGQPIDFGPIGAGPGKIAKVRAYGEIGAATASRERAEQISYRVHVRMDDGTPRTFTAASPRAYSAGERVRVENGGLVPIG